nr:hypothetical protein GCM10020185_34640 [Pseudomonas brassicacearum subsp. brassicacearum]
MQRAAAVDAGQGFVAVVFVEVQAGLLVAVFLQQAQAIPGEAGFAQWVTIVVVLGLGDAPAQRVVGHFHHAAVVVAHFNQAAFGIVGKMLHATFGAAFFSIIRPKAS